MLSLIRAVVGPALGLATGLAVVFEGDRVIIVGDLGLVMGLLVALLVVLLQVLPDSVESSKLVVVLLEDAVVVDEEEVLDGFVIFRSDLSLKREIPRGIV